VKKQPKEFERWKALWTPTQIILDSSGVERHRIEGFLPVDDLLAQLELGLGRLAFEHSEFGQAEQEFQHVCDGFPRSSAAAEACYWAGVSRYKLTHAADALKHTAALLEERYPESEWTKKALVWSG
jgi:outer membrane protein assembly factor BamD (BamD/ComL family)